MAELMPGGYYSGYQTMSDSMQQNAARIAALNATVEHNRAQQALAQQEAQRNYILTNAQMQGSPFQQQQFAAKEKHDAEVLAEQRRFHDIEAKRYDPILQANRSLITKGLQIAPDPTTGVMSVQKIEGANINKQLPIPLAKSFESGSSAISNLASLANDFQPEYAGGVAGIPSQTLGEAARGLNAINPFGEGKMSDWWRNYRNLVESPQRHAIMGAALTGREIPLWNATSINPGTRPEQAQDYMDARIGMAAISLARQAKSASTQFSPEAIKNSLGMDMSTLQKLPPTVGSLDQAVAIGKYIRGKGMATNESNDLEMDGYRFPNKAALEKYKAAKGK